MAHSVFPAHCQRWWLTARILKVVFFFVCCCCCCFLSPLSPGDEQTVAHDSNNVDEDTAKWNVKRIRYFIFDTNRTNNHNQANDRQQQQQLSFIRPRRTFGRLDATVSDFSPLLLIFIFDWCAVRRFVGWIDEMAWRVLITEWLIHGIISIITIIINLMIRARVAEAAIEFWSNEDERSRDIWKNS